MRARYFLLAASLLATGVGIATAQSASTYDAAQLPALQGKVAEYSLTPRGDIDGLILEDGTEVHLPPHLGTQIAFAVKPGDAVTIHGLRARAIPMMQGMSVTNDASGVTVTVDQDGFGPRGPRPDMHGPGGPDGGPRLTAQGPVKMPLHGPRGEVNGVLLQDGTIIRMPPPDAQRLADTLQPGATIYVQGFGSAGPLGRVIAAQAIGASPDRLTPIAPPPHRGPPGGPDMPPPPPPGGPDAPPRP